IQRFNLLTHRATGRKWALRSLQHRIAVEVSRYPISFGRFGWIADLRQIPCRTAKFAPIPDNITGRQRKPHSRTAHTIGHETAGLAARRKTQIFEAVANGGGLSYMHSGMYGRGSVRQMRSTAPAQIPGTKISVCRGVGGYVHRLRHDHHVEPP